MESWYLLRSIKPGVRVRDLCKEYQIETLREYRHRSRDRSTRPAVSGRKCEDRLRTLDESRRPEAISTTGKPAADAVLLIRMAEIAAAAVDAG